MFIGKGKVLKISKKHVIYFSTHITLWIDCELIGFPIVRGYAVIWAAKLSEEAMVYFLTLSIKK